jgi:hypothetical protein
MKACARPIYLPQESAEIPPQERRPLRLNGFRTTHAPALFSSPNTALQRTRLRAPLSRKPLGGLGTER